MTKIVVLITKTLAYNAFNQAGLIAQGFLQLMNFHYGETIWKNYSNWMRTLNPEAYPWKAVVADTLKLNQKIFLNGLGRSDKFKKFIKSKFEPKKLTIGAKFIA